MEQNMPGFYVEINCCCIEWPETVCNVLQQSEYETKFDETVYKNTAKYIVNNIVSWPHPKQWPMNHVFNLLIIRQSTMFVECACSMTWTGQHGAPLNIRNFWVIGERRDWDFIIWTCEHPVTQVKPIGVYMDLSFYVNLSIFIPIGL